MVFPIIYGIKTVIMALTALIANIPDQNFTVDGIITPPSLSETNRKTFLIIEGRADIHGKL